MSEKLCICAIDPGIVNLGIVLVDTENFIITKIIEASRIDLTNLNHHTVPFSKCTLQHSNDACDRISHFIQEYQQQIFDKAQLILMERQPIGGLVHIEQLLYHHFREKTILFSPRKIYSYYGISHLNYAQRKEASIQRLLSGVNHLPDELREIQNKYRDRLHDISDAFGLVFYYLDHCFENHSDKYPDKYQNKKNNSVISKYFLDSYFDQYKFIKK